MKKKTLYIDTTNEVSLEEGVEAVSVLLKEITQSVAQKTNRECPTCHEREWMYPDESICWRCERIRQGLRVAKPNGEIGWWWWNYRLNAWADIPPDVERSLAEWGTLD